MRRPVSAIVVTLMTLILTSTVTEALHSFKVASRQSMNLSYMSLSTSYPPDDADNSRPTVNDARKSNTSVSSKNVAATFANTSCFGRESVDKNTPRLCEMSNKHRDSKSASHVATDPVSAIFKSFFEVLNAPTSTTLQLSRHGKLPLLDEQQNSKSIQSTSLATVELVKGKHEFLWNVDHDVLESNRHRRTDEEFVHKTLTNGCVWNRHSDEVSSFDCAMALADNLTVNASRSSDDFAVSEMVSFILVGAVLSCICLATVVGNALVLVAIISNGHLRGTTHYFIANLALADLLLGVSVLPFSTALETIDRWVFGQTFCDVWAAMDVLCCTASILSLCVISVDRYIGVTRPLRHSAIVSERRAGFVIIAVWLLSLAISVAPLFGWKESRDPDSDPEICEVTKQTGYVLFSVAGSFYIPLSVILVVYYRVYREAVRQSKFLATGVKTTDSDYSGSSSSEVTLRIHTGRLATGGGSNSGSRRNSVAVQDVGHHRPAHLRITVAGKLAKFKREKKAAKTLGIVVGVFVLCWFPFFFVLPLGKLCESTYLGVLSK